jgi:hypothetical protein
MHRILVDFDKAELYCYKKAAKRMAFLKKADEVMAVTIQLEDKYGNQENTNTNIFMDV